MSVHEKAVVDDGVDLGRDVSVGPMSYIQEGVTIGDGCVIGPHVTILRHTTLGSGCNVHAGAVLGGDPQDLAFKGGESFVRIGAGCTIREGVTIHRGTTEGSATETGDNCFLMAFSHLAHNVKLGNGVVVTNGALLGGYVEVGDKAFLSANCMIHQFVKVGRLVMFSAGASATKDVPPFVMLDHLSFNSIVGLNVVGLRRAGIPPGERSEIKRAFKLLYRSRLNISQAVERIRESFESGPAMEFCSFIENSERGVCGIRSATGHRAKGD